MPDPDARLESRLAELRDAEQAGVFTGTPPGRIELPRPSGAAAVSRARRIFLRTGWAAAAAVALTVTTWVWLGRNPPRPPLPTGPASSELAGLAAKFGECFDGPQASVSPQCQEFDFDLDGDVDLADFGRIQVAAVERPAP